MKKEKCDNKIPSGNNCKLNSFYKRWSMVSGQWSLFLFLLHFSFVSNSQSNDVYAKIYLLDGSVYKGKILEVNDNSDFQIELSNSLKLKIPNSAIKKVVQLEPRNKLKIKKEKVYEFREKGFYNVSYFGVMPGYKVEEMGLGFSSNFGYMFNKYIGLGLGLGIETYEFGSSLTVFQPFWGETYYPLNGVYPVSMEARGYVFGKETAYYYSMNAGYGFVNKNEDANVTSAKGGFMFHPAIGIRMGGKKHFNLCLDFGVKFQQTEFVVPNFFESGTDHYFINYKRFILRVGLQI